MIPYGSYEEIVKVYDWRLWRSSSAIAC